MNDFNESSIEFFDGETIDDKYVELGNSEVFVYNKEGLSLKECLDFLWEQSKPHNYFFFFHYDINMFFSKEDYNEKQIDFWDSLPTKFYGYTLIYYTDKILIIKKGKKTRKFFDIGNFLKTSFLKNLKILKIDVKKEDLEFLTKFKNLRADFSFENIEKIIKYNKLECIYGKKLVEKIYNLIPKTLKTYALYGASGLAEKFLRNERIDNFSYFGYFNTDFYKEAYFGGRMEVFQIGTFKNVYKYDVNSAYPNIIRSLREIMNVSKVKKYRGGQIVLSDMYEITYNIIDKNLIGLLPKRLKSGYLVFPGKGSGWFFGAEVKQLTLYAEKYEIDYDIKNRIVFTLGDKIFNGNIIEKIYKTRQKLKKEGKLEQYIYKILLNSIYGKFCQKIGKPQFSNFYYAGLITSMVRAMLLEAVIDDPYNVIFFATDGILTSKKLCLPISKNLGYWDFEKIKKAVVLLAGVYKLINFENKEIIGQRGFKLNFDKVLKKIENYGTAKVKTNLFISNKYWHKNYKAFKNNRCKFKTIVKTIDPLQQIKRLFNTINFVPTKIYKSELIFLEQIKNLNKITSKIKNEGVIQ